MMAKMITKITAKNTNEQYSHIKLNLEERWRYYPIPILDLVAPSYNIWLTDYNRDLRWLVYGGYFSMYNVGGRGEAFIAEASLGFRQLFRVRYLVPYIDRKKRWGLYSRVSYRSNKQVPVRTFGNKLEFFPIYDANSVPDKRIDRRIRLHLTLRNRVGLNSFHFLKLKFQHTQIDERIQWENWQYFDPGIGFLDFYQTTQNFLTASYTFKYDLRDIDKYPLEGTFFMIEGIKQGLGIFKDLNTFSANVNLSFYRPITSKLYISSNIKAHKMWSPPAYYNNTRIGYNRNFIRGYENYIIDTQQYLFFRNSFRYRITEFSLPNPLFMLVRLFDKEQEKRRTTLAIFGRASHEMAFVQDQYFDAGNPLNNDWLMGTSLAVDFLLSENIPLSLEYTINKTGEKHIFLHFGLEWDFWDVF